MILQNSKGKEKEFHVLLEITKDNDKYIVYEDTNNIMYAGKYKNKNLNSLDKNEVAFINSIVKDIKE